MTHIIVKTKSPVMRATITGFEQRDNELVLSLADFEDKEVVTGLIRLPLISDTPLSRSRWWNAMGAAWGEARDQTAGGANVDINRFVGKRVRVQRVKLKFEKESYDGWDFVPQDAADIKVKMKLAKVGGAVRRFFGGK